MTNFAPAIKHEHRCRITEEFLDHLATAAVLSPDARRAWELLRDANPDLRSLGAQQRIVEARHAPIQSPKGE